MSYTMDENGSVLTETREGVTMPVDCSFEKVNDWIHGIDVQYEELVALCLGMAAENDRLRKKVLAIETLTVTQVNRVTHLTRASATDTKELT